MLGTPRDNLLLVGSGLAAVSPLCVCPGGRVVAPPLLILLTSSPGGGPGACGDPSGIGAKELGMWGRSRALGKGAARSCRCQGLGRGWGRLSLCPSWGGTLGTGLCVKPDSSEMSLPLVLPGACSARGGCL